MKLHPARRVHAANFANGLRELTHISLRVRVLVVITESDTHFVCTQTVAEKQWPEDRLRGEGIPG
jgi:hypothetical protein